jgi:hypothetical protein
MPVRGNLLSFQHSVHWKAGPLAKQPTCTVETDPLLIPQARSASHGWYPKCEPEVEMIAPI